MPDVRLSIVVSFHADDKRRLLAEVLGPAARAARDTMRAAHGHAVSYLERHWLRGPHVRWVFGDLDDEAAAQSRAESVRGHLTHVTSDRPVEAEQYLALSAKLARAELIEPPFGPLRPDNDVSVERWSSPATAGLLGPGGVELKEHYLTAALDPLAVALDNGAAPLANALVTMVANAAASPFGGLVGGQLSYRSHAEDFLANNDPDGVLRDGFHDRLRRLRPTLLRLLDDLDPAVPGGNALLDSWSATLREVWPTATRLAAQRRILEDHGAVYRERAATFDADLERLWRFGPDRTVSPMHARLGTLDKKRERVRVEEFAAYRHLTNLMIRWLTLLGITPLERYFLSYAMSVLVLERHGSTLEDVLDRMESGHSLGEAIAGGTA